MKTVGFSLLVCGLVLFSLGATAAPVATHPRLWITQEDVLRVRTWAVAGNPLWQQGLRQFGQTAAAEMDAGNIPGDDNGGTTYSPVNTEAYAALFAFLANVDPDPVARAQWALRARTLLFYILDQVDTCMRTTPPVGVGPFCAVNFSVYDRSRWHGAAFPLTVDWLYSATLPNGSPALSAADKAEIRRVFIWWSYLNLEAYPNPYNNPPQYPLPVGTIGEPLLRLGVDARRFRLRFSGNNYFAGHMRQLGMMSLALETGDDTLDPLAPATYLKRDGNGVLQEYPFADANGRLTGFLRHAVDGWLFMQDYFLRNDAQGGLPAEGMLYASTSIGIPAQFLLALETAGYGDLDAQAGHGPWIAAMSTNPFYRKLVPGLLNTLSPVPAQSPNFGQVYWPAWYGDGQQYYQPDPMGILGPLALHAQRVGDAQTLDTARWMLRHVPPGGSDDLVSRARNQEDPLKSILYFLAFDPTAPGSGTNAPDPRPQYAPSFWGAGLGRLVTRTDWGPGSRWFDFKLSWNMIDHQHGDGLMIELYRQGEWLTKGALGYGLEGGATDYKNSLAVQNNYPVAIDPESFMARMLRRGAQMPQNRQLTDPTVLARSETSAYAFVTGDATSLYNAWYTPFDSTPEAERATDVLHVSRSVFWLKPEHVVAYDRAATQTSGRFKRFWMNMPDRLPSFPAIAGDVVTGTTPGGQQIFVTSLLPVSKTLAIVTDDPEINIPRGNLWSLGTEDPIIQRHQYVDPDTGEPVPGVEVNFATRLRVDATGGPTSVRFLHVVQGADAGAPRDVAAVVPSTAYTGCTTPPGGFEGARVGPRVVLFRRDLASATQCLEYTVPLNVSDHLVSGLMPFASYDVSRTVIGADQRVRVASGSAVWSDAGGVLRFDPAGLPAPAPRLEADTDALDFAAVALGASASQSLGLTNRGGATLVIQQLGVAGAASNDYSLSGACSVPNLNLAPQASCLLAVSFAPSDEGFRSARVEVTSNSAPPPGPVALVGLGELRPDLIFRDGFD